jgi:predicted nucleotidyltransferase
MTSFSARHPKEIKKWITKIVLAFEPEKIILFGSHAWGEPTKDSDVDLLVVKKTNNRLRTQMQISRTLYPRNIPLDLLVFTPKQFSGKKAKANMFLNEITEKGEILYEKV